MTSPADTPQFWFRSDLFSIDPREDESTNPFCYGKELAAWIADRFRSIGYSPEDVIAEDWGWCVMLTRKPFLLWIGCGNMRTDLYERVKPEDKDTFVPRGDEMVWTCFVGTDSFLWTSFFWKKLFGLATTRDTVARVAGELERFLEQESRIRITEEP